METYYGYVRTPADAIKLFEACRLGLLPRVQRRLSEKERQSIRSGSVFVWDEREAGMRRWTDGKSWSASRVSGSFLTYREMEGKRGGGFNTTRRGSGKTPESGRGSDEDHDDGEPEGYRYKADGLMKQSFSITTSTGQHLHLISYYSRPQPGQSDLSQPTNDSNLRNIVPVKGMYPESSMDANQTPALTRAPMQQPGYNMPPQPHYGAPQQYPPQYGQPGYGWPPSPAATPPYSHYTTAPYQPSHQMPPQVSQAPVHQVQYAQAPYEPRASLPLPQPHKSGLPPYQGQQSQYRMPSPPRINDPPRETQAVAQAAMVESRLNAASARNPQGPPQVPLPALTAVTAGPPGSSIAAEGPPSRGHSASPPRSSHSDASAMSSQHNRLSSILNSCDNVAGAAPEVGNMNADTRALRMLDRSAFRQTVVNH